MAGGKSALAAIVKLSEASSASRTSAATSNPSLFRNVLAIGPGHLALECSQRSLFPPLRPAILRLGLATRVSTLPFSRLAYGHSRWSQINNQKRFLQEQTQLIRVVYRKQPRFR